MGEKGSFKNLYKDFLRYMAYLKDKHEKEKKIKQKYKVNKKTKVKFVSLVFFTAIISFFSSFFKSSKPKEKTVINSKKDLEQIMKNIDEHKQKISLTTNVSKINDYKNKLKVIEKVINNSSITSENKYKVNNEIKLIVNNAEEKINYINDINGVKNDNIIKNVSTETTIISKNITSNETKENTTNIKHVVNATMVSLPAFNLKQELNKLEEKLKNKKIKKEDLDYVDEILKDHDLYEIRKLRKKIEEVLYPVTIINELSISTPNITKEKDLPIQDNNVVSKSSNVNQNQNKDKVVAKAEDKKEKLKQEKEKLEEQKKKIKEKIDEDIKMDFERSISIINKQIKSSELVVLQCRKYKSNHRSFLGRLKRMVSNSFKLCASISPMFFFKKKSVGAFTSAVLLNNSIRSMRRTMSVTKTSISYLSYPDIESLSREFETLDNKTNMIFNDSLSQINYFKDELDLKYGMYYRTPEMISMYEEIEQIENYITDKQKEFDKEKAKVKTIFKKIS